MRQRLALLLFFLFGSCRAVPPAGVGAGRYDLVIADGLVVDGSGARGFRADVGIVGDRIAAIGDLRGAPAGRRLSAAGDVVAPGFIDLLGQSELNLLVDNRAESKIRQGITSEATGEGNSVAPMNRALADEMRPWLERFHLTVDWTDLDGYFRRLRRQKSAINLGSFVGAAQVRGYVMGLSRRPPTPAELSEMQRQVARAMEQGALGVSSALIYAPGSYADTAELVALARVAARYGGLYATHLRSESQEIGAALDEAFAIARQARIRVEIWHLKTAGRPNWGRMPEVLARIEAARAEGLDVAADAYPYAASFNGLDAKIPGWAHEGGVDQMVARLGQPALRQRIKREMLEGEAGKEPEYKNVGPDGILLVSCVSPALRKWMGKRLGEVARALGTSPEDALLDLVAADRANIQVINFSMSEADVETALRQPWVSLDLDAPATAVDGPLSQDRSHPRAFGTMARLLGPMVRERRLFSLEEAVRKITSQPAARLGLRDRGLLRTGLVADLTVFDPARIRDRATFEDPAQYAEGVRHVVVAGRPVLEEGRLTAERPGRVLIPGGRAPRP